MLQSFSLAMTLHTSAQQKAQAELDAVVGTDRLPTPADRMRLPYFEALLSKVIRMVLIRTSFYIPFTSHTTSLLPLRIQHLTHVTGPPHLLREDDIYNGYFIPKGAMVVVNITSVYLII